MQLPMGLHYATNSLIGSLRWLLLLCIVLSHALPSSEQQHVLQSSGTTQAQNQRKLKGRFLHITDIHPDPFYKAGSDPSGSHPCHSGRGDISAGYYGAPSTRCDSPYTLINATFDWIKEHLRDEIDFVIWTGDSARHDNDNRLPRSDGQVEEQNRFLVNKFRETFGRADGKIAVATGEDNTAHADTLIIPIVPTLGNNDILPHNIFTPGPNRWTTKFLDIWKFFIPEEQRHSFARGGWFFTEVIPDRLAVFSLNTLYFFSSNNAVDGCDLKSEPGYEHMEWLRVQLEFIRQRGMKAILIGHVPPARTESKQTWDESCYQKYTLWMHQYRDVIVGSVYGHVNIDHFMFQDVRHLKYDFEIDSIEEEEMDSALSTQVRGRDSSVVSAAKISYLNELRAVWSDLPTPPKGLSYTSDDSATDRLQGDANDVGNYGKDRDKFLKDIGGKWGERFSMSLVSPSVVPNYLPTLRIVDYNITGLDSSILPSAPPQGTPASEADLTSTPSDINTNSDLTKKKKHKKHRKKKKKPHFPVPHPPSPLSPPGPAHSPQTFTLTSWTQLFANLTAIHSDLEDETQNPKTNKPENVFNYQVEYTTNKDHVYKLKDLTVRSWLDIAERIGRSEYKMRVNDGGDDKNDDDIAAETRVLDEDEEEDVEYVRSNAIESETKKKKKHRFKDNRLWHVFVKRAFVHTKPDDELERDFMVDRQVGTSDEMHDIWDGNGT